jgi:hypothetical protein
LEVPGAMVAVAHIRVILKRESSVCLLNLMLAGARTHSESGVVILHSSLCVRHRYHSLTWSRFRTRTEPAGGSR